MKCTECVDGQYQISPHRHVPCKLCRGTGEIHDSNALGRIVLRLTRKRKAAYVRASRPQTLAGWMFGVLDQASGFDPREPPSDLEDNPPSAPDPRTE